jgi:predicted small secreted protein
MKKLRSMATVLATLLVTGLALVSLGGCNTMAGIGKDVQKVGEKVEGAAKK